MSFNTENNLAYDIIYINSDKNFINYEHFPY